MLAAIAPPTGLEWSSLLKYKWNDQSGLSLWFSFEKNKVKLFFRRSTVQADAVGH